MGSIPGRVIPKDVKRWELLLPCLAFNNKGIEQRRSGAAQWLPGSRSIRQKEFSFRFNKIWSGLKYYYYYIMSRVHAPTQTKCLCDPCIPHNGWMSCLQCITALFKAGKSPSIGHTQPACQGSNTLQTHCIPQVSVHSMHLVTLSIPAPCSAHHACMPRFQRPCRYQGGNPLPPTRPGPTWQGTLTHKYKLLDRRLTFVFGLVPAVTAHLGQVEVIDVVAGVGPVGRGGRGVVLQGCSYPGGTGHRNREGLDACKERTGGLVDIRGGV